MPGAIRQIVRNTLAAIPGGLESALILRDAILPLPPNFHPGETFHAWLRDLDNRRLATSCLPEKRVLFFACEPNWLNISLAITVVLVARNCQVDFAFLPYNRIDGEESLADMKKFQINYGRYLSNQCHPSLHFFDLRQIEPIHPTEEMEKEIELQSLLDAKYILRREEIDVRRDVAHKRVYEFRLKRNLDCLTRLASLLRQNSYGVMITPNGDSRQFGAAFRMGKIAGLKVTSFEFGEPLGAILISTDRACTDIDTSKEWNEDFPHVLSSTARNGLKKLISMRQGIHWKGFSSTLQKSRYEENKETTLSRLKIFQDNRRIVLMCPNVAWDSAVLGRDICFNSLVEWVRQTVRFFSTRKDSWLIIRIHPAETMIGTGQPLADIIQKSCPRLPDHIRVIGADDTVNTYDLMDICDFGLVYNSTTGLEMAMRGIPVIVTARPHYVGKGFTMDVETPEEYFMVIEQMLPKARGHRLSDRQIELAWCYADVYFFRWPKPFPWCLGTFWEDMDRWPMARVLSEEGQTQFGQSFDLLVNRVP